MKLKFRASTLPQSKVNLLRLFYYLPSLIKLKLFNTYMQVDLELYDLANNAFILSFNKSFNKSFRFIFYKVWCSYAVNIQAKIQSV